ncbi:hypothetical protein BGZ72_006501 [Mortierella alpina]|nr:hypothetical protein BGZ72_006501 [Mortierella alpina]
MPTNTMTSDLLTLSCLVEGESVSNAFEFEVPSTTTISTLKNLIVDGNQAPKFKNVAAQDLILWRGSLAGFKQDSAITMNALNDKTALDDPKALLSGWFRQSPDKATYIIVQRPLQVRAPKPARASIPHQTLSTTTRPVQKSFGPIQLSASIRGMFASSSRLVVCLVNEGLMQATYMPDANLTPLGGRGSVAHLTLQDLSIVVSLAHTPQTDEQGNILFLDSLDLQYPILAGTKPTTGTQPVQLSECNNPSALMRLVAARMDNIDGAVLNQICSELDSSVEHMSHLFLNPRPEPTLNSTAIEWEQSIIEGHGTHPMHKSRCAVGHTRTVSPADTNLDNPTLMLVSMPADAVVVSGEFLALMAKLVPAGLVPLGRVPVFVHPLQVVNIISMFPEATIHPFVVPALAQTSLRTVVIPKLIDYAFKLPVGIRVTSALRTVSPWSTYVGPRVAPILERIIPKSNVLKYAEEKGSVSSNNSNFAIAKHLACIIREDFGASFREKNEAVIVCAALTERPYGNTARVVDVCNLHTEASRVEFLNIYVDLAFKAFLVPLIEHGFSFEAHQQNVMVRLPIPKPGDNSPVFPCGFVVRDFGGITVHQDTLFKSIGMRVPVLPGHSIEVPDLKDAYAHTYHTLIQMNLHRLIRALDLHYSGQGWSIVRTKLESYFKPGDLGHDLWLTSETCRWKSFIRMKLEELYADFIYRDVPNIVLYKGEQK